MNILGLSAYYHDSAAALVRDGTIVAAAQEERFTRKKHDPSFPTNAAAYCLQAGQVGKSELDAVVFYEKPFTTFSRLLRSYLRSGPMGFRSLSQAMPIWFREKLWIPYLIEKHLGELGYRMPSKLWFTEHHESHAASAFFPSPFESAAVLTFDGVGEWATSSIAIGESNTITMVEQLFFPNSVGLLYSAFTYFCGFRVNSGEYKLMGLAPYGKPRYVEAICEHLIDLRDDGSFVLNMHYFDFLGGLKMTNRHFAQLFGGPARQPESEITERELDLASSIQVVTEEIVMKMARHAAKVTGQRKACLAGGVALNCVANGRLLREGIFDDVWIQPASGDAGGAVGAALYGWHQIMGNTRSVRRDGDGMSAAYLGPSFPDREIETYLEARGYPYEALDDHQLRAKRVAQLIADENVVGLFIGRMEFGPRALGHRSIVGDARSASMQSTMNLKIKFRESFRPFAPAVLAERASEYFDLDVESPYMMIVAPIRDDRRESPDRDEPADLRDWVNRIRSDIPAVTHVDYSARVQTVRKESSPEFHAIIAEFDALTGCPVVINTSFNVRGEPIVCTPEEAYRCFMRTGMDYLVLGSYLLNKADQPDAEDDLIDKTDLVLD
jgi:carbamoyltransferase